jgi:hypothetical protein
MDIPIEPALRALLRQGNVFYFVEPEIKSPKAHNFVLLNKRPTFHAPLLFVCATSQIETHKTAYAGEPAATLVVVTPQEYADFKRETLFNCNRVFAKSFNDLVRLVQQEGRIKSRDHVGVKILKRLFDGVNASRLVPENIKRQIL